MGNIIGVFKFDILEDLVAICCVQRLGVEPVGILYIYFCSFTRPYVVFSCDACIILDGISGIQNRIDYILSLIEGTDIVVNLIADVVRGSEDKLTGALSESFES